MSGKVVSWAMEQVTGSPAAKLVLVKLADNANEQGFCWPSIDLIIAHTELGQSTVYKHLATLEEMGLIKGSDHPIGENGTILKAYQLTVPGCQDAIPLRGKRKAAIPPGGKTSPPHGKEIPPAGKKIPPDGIPYKEEPSVEPSLEPPVEPPAASPPLASSKPGLFDTDDDPPQLEPGSPLDQAYQVYAEIAERAGWAQIQKRTGGRDASLRKRLKDIGGTAGWKLALEKAEASDFLCGRTPGREGQSPFRADLDFLIRESSFVKLMEGKYDNRGESAPSAGGGYLAAAGRVAARDSASDRH